MQSRTTLYVYTPRRAARWSEATLLFFKKYAVFSGRSTRSEFWWWMCSNALVMLLLSLGQSPVSTVGSLLWAVITVIPTLAISARRLNDSGLRRIWCMLPYVGSLSAVLLDAVLWIFGVDARYTPAVFSILVQLRITGKPPYVDLIGLLTAACAIAYIMLMLRQSRSSLPNAKVVGSSLNIPQDTDQAATMTVRSLNI